MLSAPPQHPISLPWQHPITLVPGSLGQIAKVLTLVAFAKWETLQKHNGKEFIQWSPVDDKEHKVELAFANEEESVPAKLLTLYPMPKDALFDTMRAAMTLHEDGVCVQSYEITLEELIERQIKEL